MRFYIQNLGCKVNAFEAESIAHLLEEDGMERVNRDEEMDLYVLFTCAVTNTAAQKSRQMIHRIQREHPNAITVVAGCYVQIDPEAMEGVDILVGTDHKKEISSYIHRFLETREPIRQYESMEQITFEPLTVDYFEKQSRSYLKIQDGCNQFCSYCVIPYARGKERSMEPSQVLESAKQLSKNHSEIVLTGIHTGRYGKEYGVSLSEMMKRILEEVPALERLRISSIEITEIDDALIQLMKENSKVARHFHIPLQAGSDELLERMNRPYTTEEFFQKINEIRQEIPDISISTDYIVGFPYETDELFEDSIAFLKKCQFSFLHVFPYSLRNGTKAAQMDHQIDAQTKKKRASICLGLSEEGYDTYKKSFNGKEVEVLFEKDENGYAFGHSSQYLPILVKGEMERGAIESVKVTSIQNHQLYGEVLNKHETK